MYDVRRLLHFSVNMCMIFTFTYIFYGGQPKAAASNNKQGGHLMNRQSPAKVYGEYYCMQMIAVYCSVVLNLDVWRHSFETCANLCF